MFGVTLAGYYLIYLLFAVTGSTIDTSFYGIVRAGVVQLFTLYYVYKATRSLVTMISEPVHSVYRISSSKSSEILYFPRILSEARYKHNRFSFFSILTSRYTTMLIAVGIIGLAQYLSSNAALWLCISSGFILLLDIRSREDCIAGSISISGICSFMVTVTVVYVLLATITSFIVSILSWIISLPFFEPIGQALFNLIGRHLMSNPVGNKVIYENPSWVLDGDLKMLIQSITSSALWFSFVEASFLVTLAYQYDAKQAGQGDLPIRQIKYAVSQSKDQTADSCGFPAVLIDQVEFYRPNLKSKDLPTFNTAWWTLAAVKIVGIIIDAKTDWQDIKLDAEKEGKLIPELQLSIDLWPMLAFPLMIIVMLISVYFHPNRDVKSFWTYHEQWWTSSLPSPCTPQEELESISTSDEMEGKKRLNRAIRYSSLPNVLFPPRQVSESLVFKFFFSFFKVQDPISHSNYFTVPDFASSLNNIEHPSYAAIKSQ